MAPTQPDDPRPRRLSPSTDDPAALDGLAGAVGRSPRSWPALLASPVVLASPAGADAKTTTVNITLTPQGCAPKPAKVATGQIQFNVKNKNAGSVSEAELRTTNLSHILGEQENLTPGLSGGFALVVQPGQYVINCPGASQQHATFTVTGKSQGQGSWKSNSVLSSAVAQYGTYVNQNAATLVIFDPGDVRRHQRRQPDAGRAALPEGPDLLRAHRAGRRGLGHARHRHRRPDRQSGDRPGQARGLPPDRRDPVGRQHPHRRGHILQPARPARAAAATARLDRLLRPGDHGQRRHRPDQRGRDRRRSPARRSGTPTPTSSSSRPTSTARWRWSTC